MPRLDSAGALQESSSGEVPVECTGHWMEGNLLIETKLGIMHMDIRKMRVNIVNHVFLGSY